MNADNENKALPDRYVAPETAGAFLDVELSTLANWRSLGVGPKFTKLSAGRSGAVRYAMSELRAFALDPVAYRARPVGKFNTPEALRRGGNPSLKVAKVRRRRGKGSRGI